MESRSVLAMLRRERVPLVARTVTSPRSCVMSDESATSWCAASLI